MRRTVPLLCVLAAGLTLLQQDRALAQAPLTSSRYRIDLFQGPVLGSPRVIGLAGAYGAVAEGAVGLPFNPAAVAHRLPFSDTWWDWDITFDYLIPGTFQTRDFDWDNNRRSLRADFQILHVGGLLQFYGFGVGVQVRSQWIDFQDSAGASHRAKLTLAQLTLGYALWRNQLIIGAGARVGSFDVNQLLEGQANSTDYFNTSLQGVEAGVLLRPNRLPLRLSASFGFGITGGVARECGESCPVGLYLPNRVSVPWELRLGAAWRLSRRAFNRPFTIKPRPRPRPRSNALSQPPELPTATATTSATAMPTPTPTPSPEARPRPPAAPLRPAPPPASPAAEAPGAPSSSSPGGELYLLISAEVVVYGPATNAVSLDGFLDQQWLHAGRRPTASGHLGLESEVWRRRLRLYLGSYFEPSRADAYVGRVHGTVGFSLRLFDFTLWGKRSLSVAAAFDGAVRYTNLSLSLSFARWH